MQIRKLRSPQEFLAAEEIQRAVWGFPDREIIPLNELVVVQKHGGHVFGAFDRGKMVAFCFGCPGFAEGKAYHYSRMLGILPGRQDSGIGFALKLKQREYVLRQGLDRVVWTYDPLQSRNAHFNIVKLGCIAGEYSVNLYPASRSHFNRGLESDRFTAEWWVASRRVADAIAGLRHPEDLGAYAPALESRTTRGGWREPVAVRVRLRDRRIAVEIPADLDRLKEDSLKLARDWRRWTRQAFLALFRRGYVVRGFQSSPEGPACRRYYLLEKGYGVR